MRLQPEGSKNCVRTRGLVVVAPEKPEKSSEDEGEDEEENEAEGDGDVTSYVIEGDEWVPLLKIEDDGGYQTETDDGYSSTTSGSESPSASVMPLSPVGILRPVPHRSLQCLAQVFDASLSSPVPEEPEDPQQSTSGSPSSSEGACDSAHASGCSPSSP
eukprot:m51a1_g4016 hypothetical protein (159) ;mRNA; f:566801-567447